MATLGKQAMDLLVAAWTPAVGETRWPAPLRNDLSLTDFDADGRLLALRDGDIDLEAATLGASPEYEILKSIDVIWAVQGEASPTRDALFDDGLAALMEQIYPARRLGDVVDDIEVTGADIDMMKEEGALPIISMQFTLRMRLVAPTPLG